jgi:ADP-Ribosyltransferase in polyvalent proteins
MPAYIKLLEEALAKLPKGSAAAKAAVANQLTTDAMKAELLAKSLQHNPPTAAGNAALADIKTTLAKKPTTAEMEAEMREKGKQKFLDPSAEKRRMYHGSKEPNIKEFKTRKEMTNESNMTGHYADERDAVFLSPDPDFTNKFSIMGYTDLDKAPTTYPVYVQAKNPFDFDNSDHLDRVKQAYFNLYHNPTSDFYNPNLYDSERSLDLHNFNKRVDRLPEDVNNWPVIENEKFQLALKNLGFDSFYTREHGTKNLGVYDPKTIKSAIGNEGTYDITNPIITKAKGGVVRMAEGGSVSQEFPIRPDLDEMRLAVARNRAGQPVQNVSDMIPGAIRGLGNTIVGAGRGSLAATLGYPVDLLNVVDIPEIMTGQSYKIPYGTEYYKEHLPLVPTSQEGKVAQDLGEFIPAPINAGVQAVKTGVKKLAPEIGAALHQAYTTGEGPLGKLVTAGGTDAMHVMPPEGKMPRMSKDEAIAAGLYHPFNDKLKLRRPYHEMTATTIDNPNVVMPAKTIITPEDLQGGAGVPLIGDRAATGQILTHVNGIELERPVYLTGGGKYMMANRHPTDPEKSSAWESGKTVVGALHNRIEDAYKYAPDVYGIYVPGSHTQVDFNAMLSNGLLGQMHASEIAPESIALFDKEMTKLAKKTPYAGLNDRDKLYEQLNKKENGALRKKFVKLMNSAKFQKLGFPDVAATRKAISEKELHEVPLGHGGSYIARMTEGHKIIQDPLHPSDYPLSMGGDYMGGFEVPMPRQDIFTNHAQLRRELGTKPAGDQRSLEFVKPIQYFDQEWVDKAMPIYQKRIKALTGKKKGGAVKKPNTDQMKYELLRGK